MRVSRPFLPLLLALLLVFSQQAGFVHALSHLAEYQAAGSSQDKKAPAGHVCEQCLSFAQIGSALPAAAPHLPVDLAADAAFIFLPPTPFGARLLRAFQSRAPPR